MLKISPRGLETDVAVYPISGTIKASQLVLTQDDPTRKSVKSEGDHRIRRIKKMALDWRPKEREAQKFLYQVVDISEKSLSGVPDYDSGYFDVGIGYKVYPLDHGLGAVPTRFALFFTVETRAPTGSDLVFVVAPTWDYNAPSGGANEVSGFQLMHQIDGSRSIVQTGNDYLWGHIYTTGSLRVLLWR